MCRSKRLTKITTKMLQVITIPVCIYMGVNKMNMDNNSSIDSNDAVVNSSVCETVQSAVQSGIDTMTTANVYMNDSTKSLESLEYRTNTSYNVDWSKLSNNLPKLDSKDTIYIDSELQKYIYDVSETFNVPYELTLAVCYVESEFNYDINNAGLNYDGTTDWGIMGLNDQYLASNCEIYNNGELINPYNPYENIYIGVQILSDNLETFNGNVYDAACAYNLGPSGWQDMKEAGETWYYGDKVLEYISTLETSLQY